MRHATYSVYAPPGKLKDVADALNNPRSPEEGSNVDPGLGPNTCRSDASTYVGLDDKLAEAPPGFRHFSLSVRPGDVDRFEAILDGFSGVRYATWHPDQADGSEWKHPLEFARAQGLERLPDQAGGPQ